ncbi:MAG: transporter substrate-binding domain-containing protein [Bacteroidales bacterium]
MKINALGVLAVLLILPFLFSSCRKDRYAVNGDPTRFSYHTEEYPPFNYLAEGMATGVSVDILEDLFKRMNIPLDRSSVEVGLWAPAYGKVLETPETMLFSMVRTDAREDLFKWVGPIAPHTDVLISLAGSGNEINQLTDLNNFFTGVVEGFSSFDLLLGHGVLRANIVTYSDMKELYMALADTREVQFIATGEASHKLILEALGYPESDFASPYIIRSDELYFAFNIETAAEMITEFQNALHLLKLDKAQDGSSVYEKILNRYQVVQYAEDGLTDELVTGLVALTASHLSADAPGTISKVNQGQHPYKDKDLPALYSFFYDTSVVMIGHADNPLLVNKSFAGKPDAAGKKFRDEIVAGALAQGSGWIDYVYTKPDQSGLYHKTTYFQLVTGSDSKQYIVCSGKFK